MRESVVLDVSVLIAAVSEGEACHVEALDLFQALKARGASLDVPATFLLEVYAVLNRRPREIRKLGFFTETDPLSVRLRPVAEEQVRDIMDWMSTHMNGKMPTRGADLAYIGVAVNAELPLVTLDRGLLQFAEAGLRVYTPQEMLKAWEDE